MTGSRIPNAKNKLRAILFKIIGCSFQAGNNGKPIIKKRHPSFSHIIIKIDILIRKQSVDYFEDFLCKPSGTNYYHNYCKLLN